MGWDEREGRGQGSLRQSIICLNRLFVLMSWTRHRQTSPVVQKRSLSLLAELIRGHKSGSFRRRAAPFYCSFCGGALEVR